MVDFIITDTPSMHSQPPKSPTPLVHCQINANGSARCGLTNPQHRCKDGLDMSIQAEQGVACHNLLDRALAPLVRGLWQLHERRSIGKCPLISLIHYKRPIGLFSFRLFTRFV